jgi:hypothetical protein
LFYNTVSQLEAKIVANQEVMKACQEEMDAIQ